MKSWLRAAVLVFCFAAIHASAHAQQPVGECMQVDGKIFGVYPNLFVVQKFYPANQGQGFRDPSGQAFMRFPSVSTIQVWVTWDMRMVQIDQSGWHVIGQCQINPQFVQSMAVTTYGMPQQYNQVAFLPPGADSGGQQARIPAAMLDREIEFVKPVVPRLPSAQQCAAYAAQGNRNGFMDCMAPSMMGRTEHAYYQCMRRHSQQSDMALCMLQQSMGSNERTALNAAMTCYQQYGANWQQYPVCALSQGMNFD